MDNILKTQGFRVLEAVSVLAVVCFVAFFAITRFEGYQARAKQSEARTNLARIFALQQAFHKANGEYASDLAELGFKALGGTRYEYSIPAASKTAFTALAQALSGDLIKSGCGARDTWVIDQGERLESTTDCTAR